MSSDHDLERVKDAFWHSLATINERDNDAGIFNETK